MECAIRSYNGIRLLDVCDEQAGVYDLTGCDCARVCLPASTQNEQRMAAAGYTLAERTLGVSITLARLPADTARMVRMEIAERADAGADMLRIALASFPDDRRFHFRLAPDAALAQAALEEWTAGQGALVCLREGRAVGFVNLSYPGADTAFIRLAAVEEKYRAAGAAAALYAKAALLCAERGYKKLEGRISSKNTAVMNLYASLGARFGAPEDIFLKEALRDDA